MFVAFKIIRDDTMVYREARPLVPGLMAAAMREAKRGSPQRFDVRARLLSNPTQEDYVDEQGVWQPGW